MHPSNDPKASTRTSSSYLESPLRNGEYQCNCCQFLNELKFSSKLKAPFVTNAAETSELFSTILIAPSPVRNEDRQDLHISQQRASISRLLVGTSPIQSHQIDCTVRREPRVEFSLPFCAFLHHSALIVTVHIAAESVQDSSLLMRR